MCNNYFETKLGAKLRAEFLCNVYN